LFIECSIVVAFSPSSSSSTSSQPATQATQGNQSDSSLLEQKGAILNRSGVGSQVSGFVTYSNPGWGIQISRPADWKVVESTDAETNETGDIVLFVPP
jgi:hypothetical protein